MANSPNDSWEFEADDPSVGIFGSYWWHCLDSEVGVPGGFDEPVEAMQELIRLVTTGEGANRKTTILERWNCPCGAIKERTYDEWDPEEEIFHEAI